MADTAKGSDFFEACEKGDISTAEKCLNELDQSCLKEWRSPEEEKTCLHGAVLAGDPDLLGKLAKKLDSKEFVKEKDKRGNTALHLAVVKYRVDLVKQLLELDLEGDLCDCENKKQESPLKIAVRFGFLEVLEIFMDRKSNPKLNSCQNENVLHLAVKFNQVKIVSFLVKKKSELYKELVNLHYDPKKKSRDDGSNGETKTQHGQLINGCNSSKNVLTLELKMRRESDHESEEELIVGDMPLHTAVRNKHEFIVDLLLNVPGVKKNACDRNGKTPLDIARELTEYHESLGIIRKLTDHPPNRKPFMYCAPEVSHAKRQKATEKIDKAFEERRNSELVVAALLATMTFTAAFTVPGSFQTDPGKENPGSPILIDFVSFKLFLIFDCVAFFLSLFACIMWQMSSDLTTGDKMLFMTVNGLLVCSSFGFTAFGFIAAMYAMLAHTVINLALVLLLAIPVFITFCGFVTSFYKFAMFSVARARFHRLYGASRLFDNTVEIIWNVAERFGLLNIGCCAHKRVHNLISRDIHLCGHGGGQNEDEDEHSNTCSCSASPWLNHRGNNV